jgi:hypothetical protein
LGNVEERGHSEGLYEYGRIILKRVLRKCIRIVFDYLCIGRRLNNILMNRLIILEFHKFLGNLDNMNNHLSSQEIVYTVCV